MEPKLFLNTPVSGALRVRPKKGNLFGLELELEGRNVGLHDVATRGWNRVQDGSLRGESIEYTTVGAKTFEDTQKLVTALFKKFDENKVKFNDSIRTSTHVHLNFSDKPTRMVINFFALFTLLEELLLHYSGEDRKGNLFCISAREAEGIVGVLADAIARCSFDRFAGDRYKYSACNLSTLYKFGTVEIRTMRGATSAEHVNKWVSIINDMYEYSLAMRSPVELVTNLSVLGAETLLKNIFKPENLKELMSTFPAAQNVHYSLMEGARLIQVFAYEFEDAFAAKVEIPDVPQKEHTLPVHTPEGETCAIWRPDGRAWIVLPEHGGDVWEHGDRVDDDPRIQWDGDRNRFVVIYPGNAVVACKWKVHPEIPDEGPPVGMQRIGMPNAHPIEDEVFRDWDDEEGEEI